MALRELPERIVSLVPSLTEALFAFGAGERVVGCTRYCTQPPRSVGGLVKVGGTRKVSVSRVLGLEPDLVVAVKEENDRENVEALRRAGVPVLLGAPESVAGALAFLRELADRVGAPDAERTLGPAERVYERLREGSGARRRVFVPIWKDPYMSFGSDTYAHDVIETCGGLNVFGCSLRYPTVTPGEIEAAGPEMILLPDEPYQFSAVDLKEIQALDTPAAREDRIHLVDGKLLTWYGPRMASSLTQLSHVIRW